MLDVRRQHAFVIFNQVEFDDSSHKDAREIFATFGFKKNPLAVIVQDVPTLMVSIDKLNFSPKHDDLPEEVIKRRT